MLTQKQWRRVKSKVVGLSLFILPLPLLLKTILSLWTNQPGDFAASGASWLLFLLAAIVCRRGLQAELMEADRPFASNRASRLKMAGGVLVALATMATALFAAGHGADRAGVRANRRPRLFPAVWRGGGEQADAEDPGLEGDEVGRLLRQAYARLDSIETARRGIASGEFRQRLGNIVTGAERIIKLVADDPRDLRRAEVPDRLSRRRPAGHRGVRANARRCRLARLGAQLSYSPCRYGEYVRRPVSEVAGA